MCIIKGRLEFIEDSILDFRELVAINESPDYRFHWMDANKRMIIRWDSAPHHQVRTFPYHKHTKDGVSDSEIMNLISVLEIIESHILREY
ncbi:MAG: DUF6516 family protein [Methanosarcinales archaeon]